MDKLIKYLRAQGVMKPGDRLLTKVMGVQLSTNVAQPSTS